MTFIADESTDQNIISLLRDHKYIVISIKEISPGVDDEPILKMCNQAKHILITEDKDFGDLVYQFKIPHHGIVLVRCHKMPNKEKAQRVFNVIKTHLNDLEKLFYRNYTPQNKNQI